MTLHKDPTLRQKGRLNWTTSELPCPGQANRSSLQSCTASFFPKDTLDPGSLYCMADEVLEAYVKQLIESQKI